MSWNQRNETQKEYRRNKRLQAVIDKLTAMQETSANTFSSKKYIHVPQ